MMPGNKQTKCNEVVKILSEKVILNRYKTDDITKITKLNLWGYKLTDISILTKMPQLQVISLSANYISQLEALCGCLNLQELFLRKNKIEDVKEILHLKSLTHLHTLWLGDNPMCSQLIADNSGNGDVSSSVPLYRAVVIHHLPQVQILDDIEITISERSRIALITLPLLLNLESSTSLESMNKDISELGTVDDNFFPICSREYNSSKYIALETENETQKSITSGDTTKSILVQSKEDSTFLNENDTLIQSQNSTNLQHESIGQVFDGSISSTEKTGVIASAIGQLISLVSYSDLLNIKSQIESRLELLERDKTI